MGLNRVLWKCKDWSRGEVAFKSSKSWAMVSGFEEGQGSWVEATTTSTKVKRTEVAPASGSWLSPSAASSDLMSSGYDENKNVDNNLPKKLKPGLNQMSCRTTRLPSAQPDFEWVLRWTCHCSFDSNFQNKTTLTVSNCTFQKQIYLFRFQFSV